MHKIMKRLNSTNSRLSKEEILEEVMSDLNWPIHRIFCEGFKRALDTFETFGIRTDHRVTMIRPGDGEEDWSKVTTLLDMLASRRLTGSSAFSAVALVAMEVNNDDWNDFYNMILLKDMKCGVNVSTWNKVAKKVAPEYVVPVFTCQLAKDAGGLEGITGTKLVEVKLDGVRVLTIVQPSGEVEMFSRSGKPLKNFSAIEQQFKQFAHKIFTPIVFDGEIMSSSFQDLMKQVHRKSDVQTDDAILYLFDMIPYDDFRKGSSDADQAKRSYVLSKLIEAAKADDNLLANVETVQYESVNLDEEAGQLRMKEINAKAIEGGYEGIMLKDPTAPYECKRVKSWLKIKPTIEVTLEIIAVKEGTGKYKNMVGSLVCEGVDTGKVIKVDVGSGLTDKQRQEIWDSPTGNIIGQMIEVKADAITQSQDQKEYSLRFPRFKCFRGFKKGEKL